MPLKDSYVPIIIINAPIKAHRTKNISQADIFPTILYLMGKEGLFIHSNYVGIGTNINCIDSTTEPDDCTYEISKLVIRSKR